MTASVVSVSNVYTLSHRLSEGEMSLTEALQHATSIAESLRDLHDSGKIHGWLTPSAIAITREGAELINISAPHEEAGNYTAPEVLAGELADVRSDIYSLAAILSAMIGEPQSLETRTGSPAVVKPPRCTGAVERFLKGAMAHDPAARPQRVHKVLVELKFLMISARRTETESGTAVVRELRRSMEAVNRRLVDAEREIEDLRHYAALLEEKLATSLQSQEQTLREHASAIELAQSSTEQTDVLVERVVDALGLLQSTLIGQSEAAQPPLN